MVGEKYVCETRDTNMKEKAVKTVAYTTCNSCLKEQGNFMTEKLKETERKLLIS